MNQFHIGIPIRGLSYDAYRQVQLETDTFDTPRPRSFYVPKEYLLLPNLDVKHIPYIASSKAKPLPHTSSCTWSGSPRISNTRSGTDHPAVSWRFRCIPGTRPPIPCDYVSTRFIQTKRMQPRPALQYFSWSSFIVAIIDLSSLTLELHLMQPTGGRDPSASNKVSADLGKKKTSPCFSQAFSSHDSQMLPIDDLWFNSFKWAPSPHRFLKFKFKLNPYISSDYSVPLHNSNFRTISYGALRKGRNVWKVW